MNNRRRGKESRRSPNKFKWAELPTRKPLAVFSALFVAVTVTGYAAQGTDIPQGIAGLLETLLYVCVGGYAATSAYESVRSPSYRREEGEEEE